jgi:hypothetical protein
MIIWRELFLLWLHLIQSHAAHIRVHMTWYRARCRNLLLSLRQSNLGSLAVIWSLIIECISWSLVDVLARFSSLHHHAACKEQNSEERKTKTDTDTETNLGSRGETT